MPTSKNESMFDRHGVCVISEQSTETGDRYCHVALRGSCVQLKVGYSGSYRLVSLSPDQARLMSRALTSAADGRTRND